MPVKVYETLFLLDSTKVSSDADGVKQQLHNIIERHGGRVDISRPWDYNHKLSYPIAKQKKGSFHIVYYSMESTKQVEFERDLALQEGLILRQMTSRIDPKWQEEVLKVAREDGSNGFALRGMMDEAAVQTDPAAIGGEPNLGEEGGPPPRGDRGEGGGGRGPRRPRGEMSDKPE
jgi:small subunit ribosomal protein S6